MKTSRHQVLEYIHAHRQATAGEISQSLRMSEPNARHHLGILRQQGLIELAGERPKEGKGRPAQIYRPAQGLAGHNLDRLCAALLVESVERDQLLARAAQRLSKGEKRVITRDVTLTSRLMMAVQRLNEMHYQARWEAHRNAPRLILERCPYAAIIQEHPELCMMDAMLLIELLETVVEQTAKLEQDNSGLTHCIFQIKAG